MFSSSASNLSRGSSPLLGDLPPISQCLVLEPFPIVDPKYPKSGELRKVLGVPLGSSAEDGSFGANHAKVPHQVAMEELKRFKSSLLDASMKARTRVKRLDDSLQKLNKYHEVLNPKKQQRSESLMNERPGGSNLKTGSQLHRNSSDLSTHRLEDRAKNAPLNKRFRTSVAELRGECQGNTPTRQSFVMGKDRDVGRDGGEGSDPLEEKIRRLPAGGESWDKKMKRKRSIGTVFSRPVEGDGEVKRATQKVKNDTSLQFSDAQTLRSGSLNGGGGMNKSDSSSLAPGSNIRGFPKNEQEKASLQRDFSPASAKDRALAKGNNKLSMREDIAMQNPTPVTKGKASRAPRSGPIMAASSPNSLPRASGGLESWEQSPSVPKVHFMGGPNNNRKRPLPSGSSSSPPMTQWVGQRPQKISRTRRANVISPVLNNDEIPNSSEGCSSDLGPKMTSMSRNFASGIQQLKVKLDNVSSPARLSESEESGAGESHEGRSKEKRAGSIEVDERDVVPVQNVGSSGGPMKKSRMTSKDEIGDVVQREGRSGRGPSFARASSSPSREKLENAAGSKPHRSMRAGSDKNGSKSGRPPLKKLSERKVITRPGKTPAGSTPDFSGESDDDREELLAAASFASSASYSACIGNFWKKMEPVFASICSEDVSYSEQQIKSSEEFHDKLSKKLNSSNSLKGNLELEENPMSQTHIYGAGDDDSQGQHALKEMDGAISLVEDDIINIYGRLDPGGMKVIPMTQRLLASLIVEDEAMVGGDCEGSNPFHHSGENHISCPPINGNLRENNYNIEYDYQFVPGPQFPNQLGVERSCNGVMSKNIHSPANCDILRGGYGQLIHSGGGFAEITENGYTCDEQYARMSVESKVLLELHSIGLYPENVPDLADGEDDSINNEISDLHKILTQKIDAKRACLSQLIAAGKGDQKDGRDLEQIAMDKHIEAAYKKQLATRATYASKYGIPKVPKHVAVAFTKRALVRCRKFEETGKSCFSEPPFIEALSAPPPRWEESLDCAKLSETTPNSKPESGAAGPFSSRVDRHDLNNGHGTCETNGTIAKTGPLQIRGKKKEVLLDDIGGKPPSLRIPASLGNTFSGGAKGKRSDRERDRDRDPQTKNAKTGRQINAKGERKTKAKPKQRTAQLSTSVNGFISNSSDVKRETVGAMPSNGNVGSDTAKENKESVELANLDLPIDSIDDLDVPGWFNFDGDGLQDIDSAGLEIPMDDLSDVFL
ncbi:hypothetical protein CDL15_Pgr011503 [Punica granatum]|uniref:Uncharacterized protein n=1 Tax=Punica granatum TaxID=22663 RepID=A0A218VV03_PUNGR|nr:hypothetical protein CDL15_Pgr011503 [Punica granatum]